jgi:transcriptional regulator with XRE-family HTH domain
MQKITSFGKKLRELRTKHGLKQEDLAEKSGLTQSAISHFEKGLRAPNKTHIERITSALGINSEELLNAADLEKRSLLNKIEFLEPGIISELNDYVDFLKTRHLKSQIGIENNE